MNIGNITLLLSLMTGLISFILLYLYKEKISKYLLYFSVGLIFTSFILLIYHFLTDNFANIYVYNYSSKNLPLFYKISAAWAGQQGSLLLWLTIFSLSLLIFIKKNRSKSILVIYLYILLMVIISSPFFFYSQHYPDGRGLNPVLKNIWMISHPPLLFLGYSFTIFPFALLLDSLKSLNLNNLIKKAHPWITGAALFLGLGIFTGSYWAYTTPGWGGFWGWDPVENSSLVPWLLLIILIHSVSIQKKYKHYAFLNITLITLVLASIITGTYLTRSGSLNNFSVHSFIKSPVSKFLLIAIIAVIITPLAGILWKKKLKEIMGIKKALLPFQIQNFLLPALISILLFTIFIFIATTFPVLSKFILNESYKIKTDFYNTLVLPFTYCFLILLFLSNYKFTLSSLKSLFKTIILFTISIYCAFLIISYYKGSLIDLMLFFLILINMFCQILKLFRELHLKTAAQFLCHTGFLLVITGIIISNASSGSYSIKCYKNKISRTEYGNFSYKKINNHKTGEKNIYKITCHVNNRTYQKKYRLKNKQLTRYNSNQFIIHNLTKDIFLEPLAVYSTSHKKNKLINDFILINIKVKRLIILLWTGFLLISSGLAVKLFTLIYDKQENKEGQF